MSTAVFTMGMTESVFFSIVVNNNLLDKFHRTVN